MRIGRIQTPRGVRHVAQRDGVWSAVEGLFGDLSPSGETFTPREGDFLRPVEPVVVVGIAHHAEGTHALPIQAWLKSPRTVTDPGGAIVTVPGAGEVIVEGELAAVIGRTASNLTVENAFDHVLGFTVANDVTNADQGAIDDKNFQGKAGSGYTPLGPWIETNVHDPESLGIVVTVDGEILARSSTAALPSLVAETLVYVTRWLTLEPGDVVMTGSPSTAASIAPGAQVEIEIEGVGSLRNPVT